jgi:hypothetical protein
MGINLQKEEKVQIVNLTRLAEKGNAMAQTLFGALYATGWVCHWITL